MYHWGQYIIPKSLDSCWRHIMINTDSGEETGKSRMERGHWATAICYNCSKLWLNLGCCCMLSSQFQVFDINGTALLVKLGTLPRLPDLKINTGQELFLMLLTAGTCGKRPGLRNPSTIWDKGYFYLLFIHTGPVANLEKYLFCVLQLLWAVVCLPWFASCGV